MMKTVLLTQVEWDNLPVLLARKLLEAIERDGLALLHQDGKPYSRVRDYLTGTLKLAQLTIQEDDTDDPLDG